MRRFRVLLVPQAQRQIEEIHDYIFSELRSPKAAVSTEDAIIDGPAPALPDSSERHPFPHR